MRTALLAFSLIIGCNRQNTDAPPAEPAETDIVVPIEPVLHVSSPVRQGFSPSGSVVISGNLEPGSAPLAGLTLNDNPLGYDGDGAFSSEIFLTPGINVLSLRVEDEDGGRAVDGRAVYGGPLHDPGTVLGQAVRVQLGPELLDDDDPDIDDVASIAELLLTSGDMGDAFVGKPLKTSFADITPTLLEYQDAAVDIVPAEGALEVTVVLYDVWMDFDVDGGWFSTDGSAWIDAMTLSLVLESDDGTVTPATSEAQLDGYGLTVDWFPDWLEDDLADWTVDTLEEEISTMASSTVSELVEEYLGAFAVEAEVLDDVWLSVGVAEIASSDAGLRLTLDASVDAPDGALVGSMPDGAGSAATDGTAPSWPDSGAPFWVAVDDDVVNQVLFSVWASGALDGFSYSGAELALLSGSELVPPLGPAERIELGVALPPTLHAPLADDMTADLGIGEWTMTFHREDGEVLSFSVNARTGTNIQFTDEDDLSLTLDNRPANMTIAVGVMEHPESLDPGDLAALVKLMVPPLFGNASAFLPGIALPPLDLELVDPSLAGTALYPSNMSLALTEGRWLTLSGELAAQ